MVRPAKLSPSVNGLEYRRVLISYFKYSLAVYSLDAAVYKTAVVFKNGLKTTNKKIVIEKIDEACSDKVIIF